MNYDPSNDRDDDADPSAIQIDLYGIKATAKPAKTGRRPHSWAEVARRLNEHLMTIAERAIGVVAETFVATGNIIRGIGRIPNAIASRISGAHTKADRLEESRKESAQPNVELAVVASPTALPAPGDVETRPSLEEVLDFFRAKGAAVEVFRRRDGSWGFVIVRPEQLEVAKCLLDKNPINEAIAVLTQSSRFNMNDLTVRIDCGKLVLRGTVSSNDLAKLAEELVSHATRLPVHNLLEILES